MGVIVCGTNVPPGTYFCTYYHLDDSCTCYLQSQESDYIESNFQLQEFAPTTSWNPDGTSQNWQTYQKLADQLQSARSALGAPIKITSGYRTGGPVDPHHYGLAADTNCSSKTFVEVAQAYYNAGFRRIEVMKPSGTSYNDTMSVGGHIHVDVYNPNESEYDADGAFSVSATWYAYGLEGGSYTSLGSFSELISYLEAH